MSTVLHLGENEAQTPYYQEAVVGGAYENGSNIAVYVQDLGYYTVVQFLIFKIEILNIVSTF